jgi:predicted metal-dependent hydrolase
MMRATSSIILSTASSELIFTGGGRSRALVVRRMAQARRMRLTVDPRDGAVRLVLPKRAALAPALRWAGERRDWIEAALADLPLPRPILPGGEIPFDGRVLTIDWRADRPRTVRIDADRLMLGGPEDAVAMRVLRWLRAEAARRLEAETRAMAVRAEVSVGRISVGDARARWGSCSSGGDIRYSWRLILAPPAVREATVAHEVAHRLHMHHGPAFHDAVAQLLGRDPAPERRWLRDHGSALYWLGRDG